MLLRQGLVDLGDGRVRPGRHPCRRRTHHRGVARHLDVGDEEVVDCSGFLVVPGMVNAHAHSNENWFRGLFDSLPLELWELGTYPVFEGPAAVKARDLRPHVAEWHGVDPVGRDLRRRLPL